MIMAEHKSKIFKKVFDSNADFDMKYGENALIPVMSREIFVPLMGQLWDKAKERYKKKYHKRYLKFAEWLIENKDYFPKDKSIEDLFWDWRKEK